MNSPVLRHPEPRRRRRISFAHEILRSAQDDGWAKNFREAIAERDHFRDARVELRQPRLSGCAHLVTRRLSGVSRAKKSDDVIERKSNGERALRGPPRSRRASRSSEWVGVDAACPGDLTRRHEHKIGPRIGSRVKGV